MAHCSGVRRVLILGVGNILMADEGLGVHIVRHIRDAGPDLPRGVELLDGGTAGYDLMGLMRDFDKIVIVDALGTDDAPGSIYRFTPADAAAVPARWSLHEAGIMNVIQALDLAGNLPEIEFVGMVPGPVTGFGLEISGPVRESMPRAVEIILDAAR